MQPFPNRASMQMGNTGFFGIDMRDHLNQSSPKMSCHQPTLVQHLQTLLDVSMLLRWQASLNQPQPSRCPSQGHPEQERCCTPYNSYQHRTTPPLVSHYGLLK